MLNKVQSCISSYMSNNISFNDRYNSYVCAIQDIDIDNEILPIIKQKSTEYIKSLNKHKKEINKIRKSYCDDNQL